MKGKPPPKTGDSFEYMIVHWVDSSTKHGWQLDDQPRAILDCISVGVVLEEDDDVLVLADMLAPTKGGSYNIHCPQTIPKVSIVRVQRLRLPAFAVAALKRGLEEEG